MTTVNADSEQGEPAWANLKGEITRKTVNAMERLLDRHTDGELTERELRIALDAVFDTVQGLAERDVEANLYGLCRSLPL